MTEITTAHVTSSATAENVFAVWADMAHWQEWNSNTEWVRLDGDFVEGAKGHLKPSGAPTVPFTIARLVPGQRFVDVSRLFGARLTFDHTIEHVADGIRITVVISLSGPLAAVWRWIMGPGLVESAPGDLDALARRAESIDEGAVR